MHVRITTYSLDHAAARRCTRGSTIIRWRGECRWQPTDSISLPSLWMASTASLTCGAIPRVCPSSYHHTHNSSYLYKMMMIYDVPYSVIPSSEPVIQSAETSHGRSLLSVMFSPKDSTQLAITGDGGAQVIDIRADPNK